MKCALRAQLEEKLYISTSPFTRCAYNGRCGNNTKAAILDGVIYSGAYQRAARASWSAFKVHWSRALSQALPFICNDAERQPRTGGVQIDVLGEIISQKWNGEARFCNIFVFFALWFFPSLKLNFPTQLQSVLFIYSTMSAITTTHCSLKLFRPHLPRITVQIIC